MPAQINFPIFLKNAPGISLRIGYVTCYLECYCRPAEVVHLYKYNCKYLYCKLTVLYSYYTCTVQVGYVNSEYCTSTDTVLVLYDYSYRRQSQNHRPYRVLSTEY